MATRLVKGDRRVLPHVRGGTRFGAASDVIPGASGVREVRGRAPSLDMASNCAAESVQIFDHPMDGREDLRVVKLRADIACLLKGAMRPWSTRGPAGRLWSLRVARTK